MCRHLAYLGPPVRLGELLLDPPNSLVTQSWAPRRQTHGVVNVDGFGVGWYVPGHDEPARHRGTGPVWADETFADLMRVTASGSVLAAVRSATAGMPPGTAAAAPFRHGRWLFSHNGALEGWPGAAVPLVSALPTEVLLRLDASSDAAVLHALVVDRLLRGQSLPEAVGAVTAEALKTCGGRVNLLVTDGRSVVATAAGASLCHRERAGGVVVASEPYDDEPGWLDVPDRSLLTADAAGVRVETL
jgi:glutamine amidotransferase